MARKEKELSSPEETVVQKMKSEQTSGKPVFACLMIVLGVFMAGVLFCLWTIASTGLVRIPVLTSWAYEPPVPLREVSPGAPVEEILKEQVASNIMKRFRSGGRLLPSSDQETEVSLPEASLTTSLRTQLAQSGIEALDMTQLQVVLDPDVGMQVFIPLKESDLQTAVILFLDVTVVDGSVALAPQEVFVGNARVPDFLVRRFFTPLLKQRLAQFNQVLVGVADLSSLTVLQGELVVKGKISLERPGSL